MKSAFTISGVAGFLIWPACAAAAVMGASAAVEEGIPINRILGYFAWSTAMLPPLVWIAAFVLAMLESKRGNRPNFISRCIAAPYVAFGLQILSLVMLFTLGI